MFSIEMFNKSSFINIFSTHLVAVVDMENLSGQLDTEDSAVLSGLELDTEDSAARLDMKDQPNLVVVMDVMDVKDYDVS